MPTRAAHIAAAKANQATIDYLRQDPAEHLPWIATVGFYKALHLVEVLLDADPQSPKKHTDDHKTRNRLLKKTVRYGHIWKNYSPLFQASMIARYLRENENAPTYEVFSNYMPAAKVDGTLLGHYLHQVEIGVGRLIRDADYLT